MPVFILVLICCIWIPNVLYAQADLQPRWLVDGPTAGLLPRGSFSLDFRFYEGNGILAQMEVGVFNRANVGFSFGGQHIVGNQAVRWNRRVEFAGKIRVIEEGFSAPALAVGYQSQGYGAYDKELERYTTKSKGFYAVLSKNFGSSAGDTGFHGGINRSLEGGDDDGDISGFVGIDQQFGKSFTLLAEYDFALNDNEGNSLGSGRGLLNAGARWAVSSQLALELNIRNIFRNGHRNPNPDREIRLLYFEKF